MVFLLHFFLSFAVDICQHPLFDKTQQNPYSTNEGKI